MTLRDKPFERTMHAMLWTVRPPTWEQMRNWTRGATGARPGLGGVSRILIRLVMFPSALAVAASGSVPMFVGVIAFWAIVTVLWQSSRLVALLYQSPELPVYAHLPVPPESIFALQRRAFMWNSIWVLLDFWILYGVLAYRVGFGVDSLGMALMMGAIQWWVTLAGVTGLLAFFPKLRFEGLVLFSPLLLGGVAFLVLPYVFWNLAGWFTAAAPWIPPVGWIIRLLGADQRGGFVADFIPGLALGALLTVFPLAQRRLRAAYSPPEPIQLEANLSGAAQITRAFIKSPPGQLVVAVLCRLARIRPWRKSAPTPVTGATDDTTADQYAPIRAAIRTRKFLAGYDWRRSGWCERLAARFLSPEDRLAAEFMGGGKPAYTRVVIIGGLCALFPGAFVVVFPNWGNFALPFFWMLPMVFANVGSGWIKDGKAGAKLMRVGGQATSLHSVYPIRFWSLVRLNILRGFLTITALCLGATVSLLAIRFSRLRQPAIWSGFQGGTSTEILWISGELWRLVFLVYAALPVFAIMPCSRGSNDIHSPGRFLAWTAILVTILGTAVWLLCAGSILTTVGAGTLFAGVSAGSLWLYGRAYNRNGFDLIRKASRGDPGS